MEPVRAERRTPDGRPTVPRRHLGGKFLGRRLSQVEGNISAGADNALYPNEHRVPVPKIRWLVWHENRDRRLGVESKEPTSRRMEPIAIRHARVTTKESQARERSPNPPIPMPASNIKEANDDPLTRRKQFEPIRKNNHFGNRRKAIDATGNKSQTVFGGRRHAVAQAAERITSLGGAEAPVNVWHKEASGTQRRLPRSSAAIC